MAEAATLKIVLTDAGQPGGKPGVPAPITPGVARPGGVAAGGARGAAAFGDVARNMVGQLIARTGFGEVVQKLGQAATLFAGAVAGASAARAAGVGGVGQAAGAAGGVAAGGFLLPRLAGTVGPVAAAGFGLLAAVPAFIAAVRHFGQSVGSFASTLSRYSPALAASDAMAFFREMRRERFQAEFFGPALIRIQRARQDLEDQLLLLTKDIKLWLYEKGAKLVEHTATIVGILNVLKDDLGNVISQLDRGMQPGVKFLDGLNKKFVELIDGIPILGDALKAIRNYIASLDERAKKAQQQLGQAIDRNFETVMNLWPEGQPEAYLRGLGVPRAAFDEFVVP